MGTLKTDIKNLVARQQERLADSDKIGRRLIEAGVRLIVENDQGWIDQALVDWEYNALPFSGYLKKDKVTICYGDDSCQEDKRVMVDDSRRALIDAGATFSDYAIHHFTKSPPDREKGRRNAEMAERCFRAAGYTYVAPTEPAEIFDTSPVQVDSEVQAPDLPRSSSTAPLSRSEVLKLLNIKMAGAKKNDMHDVYSVLLGLRDELAQNLEEQPIDTARALREFFTSVHAGNVKAGWWRDLATGTPKKRSVGELLMLFVTEIVEAYDAWSVNAPDDKLPHHPGLGVELADLGIRWADFCGALAEGKIVINTDTRNPGDSFFRQIATIAREYESIRKTDAAIGDPEEGDFLPPADVASMVIEKIAFNAVRPDHKIENRLKEDGKRT